MLLFDLAAYTSPYVYRFASTELGQLKASLPIEELASLLPERTATSGPVPRFDNGAKIALQFLKSYTGQSDEKLLSSINTDWSYQLFIGFLLKDTESIKDKNVIWQVRKAVAEHLDISMFQQVLAKHWKPQMEATKTSMCDATVYESYIKYPTQVKLLWDSVKNIYGYLKRAKEIVGGSMPRNKYREHKKKQGAYQMKKRKTYKDRQKRIRELIYLLNKLLYQLEEYFVLLRLKNYSIVENWKLKDLVRIQTIGKIYEQQRFLFEAKDDKERKTLKNVIVSLYKPYLRAIVRGKENKRVEFGAKCNMWQVDGLNFFEHFSFSAFHEGIRLPKGIDLHRQLFGSLRRFGGDRSYATNHNRTLCSKNNIQTNFDPKGRPPADETLKKQQKQMRQIIGKQRATVLEGSFGNEKNHYGLNKIKARNEKTETLMIFFGVMTANAIKVTKKRIKLKTKTKSPPHSLARAA